MRSTRRILLQLEGLVSRSRANVYAPECSPSTSYAPINSRAPGSMLLSNSSVSMSQVAATRAAPMEQLQYLRRLEELLRHSGHDPLCIPVDNLPPRQQQQLMQQQPSKQPQLQLNPQRQPAPSQHQRQQQQQQAPSHQRKRKLDLDSIPMLSKQSTCGAPPQQQQQQAAAAQPAVDWQQIVELARRHQLAVTGREMLTDSYRRHHTYLRISLTERCNLRCTYCMPEEGVELTQHSDLLSTQEVMRLASLFVRAGVTKIRLTGGEPTLRRDLLPLTAGLAALPGLTTLAITSNGITLPRQLPALRAAGLSALNISLDTLRPERFEAMTRRPAEGHAKVMAAIDTALRLGYDPVKVNVVVMRGVNDDELVDFVELTRHAPVNVRFIEYMPFDGNVWSDRKMVPFKDMKQQVSAAFPGGLQRLADPAAEVAKNYRVPGFVGSVSFITSMTQAFCGDCNRLRLLADGALKVCLFGPNEVSLRDAMRSGASDEELALVISAAVDRKKAAHAGMFELAATANRPMITIGG